MKKSFQFGKRERILWCCFLVIIWGTVLFLLIRAGGSLTLDQILNYRPENPFLTCLVMVGLFLVKSVDFLINSGLLYAADGIMFSLPFALLLNTLGIVIMILPTYLIGRAFGPALVQSLTEKYPKLRSFEHEPGRGEVLLAVLLRTVGIPIPVAGLYMGATEYTFWRFLLGSVLGILPAMTAFTVMGDSAHDLRSPAFIASVAVGVLLALSSGLVYARMQKKKRGKDEAKAEDEALSA